MTETLRPDLCIIGAGSGGLSLAAGAVQMGARVVLIEGGEMGGDCLNAGCVPSKALLAAAKRAQAMRDAGPFGIAPVVPDIDFGAVKDHVRDVIATIAPVDSQERFEGLGVTVLRDWARFVAPDAVEAGGRRIMARRFVVATGSRPFVPPIPGIDGVTALTNETIFDLRERPDHLLVLGGGPIGIEMAQAHRRLGSRVTVIEAARALPKDDPELAAIVLARLRAEGVEIVEGARATRITAEGGVTIETERGRHSGSHLLVAAGRVVDLARLDPNAGGIAHDRGIVVDAGLRSVSNRRVYAIGDAAGGMQFTHLAGYHAGVVIRSILFGLPSRARTHHIPWVTYTEPELAQVGLTEAQARAAHGDGLTVVRSDFTHNDRAIAERHATGFAKIMVHRGRPVGASLVGPGAGDHVALWALALSARLKMSAVAGMVAPYPTTGEISRRAAGAYFSPRLFDTPWVKRAVRAIQRVLP